MKCIVAYYEMARKAVSRGSKKVDKVVSYSYLKQQTNAQFNKLRDMKFLSPTKSKQEIIGYFNTLLEEIDLSFKQIVVK
jgi:hypothetical protein